MNPVDTTSSTTQEMTRSGPNAQQKSERPRPKGGWLAVSGLLLLSILPVIGGVLRLTEGRGDREGEFLVVSLVAIVAHIVSMSVFCLLGAFQFSPALRFRRGWHRTAGRVLIPAGFIAAASGIWLVVFFGGPEAEFPIAVVRIVFAVPMAVFLALAVNSITRRDFTAHGAWMTRAYAIAVTGGTQAIVAVMWSIPFGEVDALEEAWVVAVGFAINSVVAEVLIWRRSGRRSKAAAA